MKRSNILIAFLVLAAIAIASAFFFYSSGSVSPPPTPGSPQAPAPSSSSTRPMIGGPFALVDGEGRRVTDQDFRGRFMMVQFGYTHCPDVCPLGLEKVTQALEQMPQDLAGRVQPVFITIDPARDTPEVLREYASHFHPRLVALTGGEEEVAAAVKAYRVYARKAEGEGAEAGGGYLMDHSTFTYVMGPDGGYVAHFGHDATPEAMAERLAELVRADAGGGGRTAAATS
jgi:cytochrome oxidase Cu insertion factor (SCO1/SenC/PrrC family)